MGIFLASDVIVENQRVATFFTDTFKVFSHGAFFHNSSDFFLNNLGFLKVNVGHLVVEVSFAREVTR